jgi:phosphoribosylglycinamide formyltransferase 1
MLKIGVLGSGKGSNFQSIYDAIAAGLLDAEIRCVAADVPDAYILERARKLGVPAGFIDCAPFKTKIEGDGAQRMLDFLADHDVDFVALAGFMRIVKEPLLSAFPERMVNIHPALLPAFPGLESWKQALDYGAKLAGCTVHFIDAGMDTGPIIVQRAVAVHDDDTAETLHARIQIEEHIAYPEALRLIADGRVSVVGRRVRIAAHPPA